MADQMQAVRDDIAFMRALAQEGRTAPLLGGSIMVAAGLIFGGASFGNWLGFDLRLITDANWWINPLSWVAATAIFYATCSILTGRLRAKAGARSPGNRATRLAWAAVGWAIVLIAVCASILTWRTHDGGAFALFPSTIFALYGAAWTVSAGFSGKRWLWATALGCFAAAVVMAWLLPALVSLLAFSILLVLLTVPQGLMMMRQEPAELV
jgi:hypothetical protein